MNSAGHLCLVVRGASRAGRAVLFCATSLLLASGAACAFEVRDPLTTAKLDRAWEQEISPRSRGSLTAAADGVALKAEPHQYVLLRRATAIRGSDAHPLRASVLVLTERGAALEPGLHLWWEDGDHVSLCFGGEKGLALFWSVQGVRRERSFPGAAPEPERGAYLRFELVSRNLFVWASPDGAHWRQLAELGERPGNPEHGPHYVLLGRGWAGDPGRANNRPALANPLSEGPSETQIVSRFRDFALAELPLPMPGKPAAIPKADTWDECLAAVSEAGVPKAWDIVGPIPDQKFARFNRSLAPDLTDDWRALPKSEAGVNLGIARWTRPEGAVGALVDLAEALNYAGPGLAYARAIVESPVSGGGLLWFDSPARAVVCWNGRQVLSQEEREPSRGPHEAWAVPVALRRGHNVLKIKCGHQRALWSFHARVEQDDPEYRIGLLEGLVEAHGRQAPGSRSAPAVLEIARRHEQRGDYRAAGAAYDRVLKNWGEEEECRLQALGGKLALLERLRDWEALGAAGEEFLAQWSGQPGADWALRAALFGRARSGALEAAEKTALAEAERAGADGRRVWFCLRMLAHAAAGVDAWQQYAAALGRLASHAAVGPVERASAMLDAALGQPPFQPEDLQAREPPDPARLSAASGLMRKALALLPGRENGQARRLAEEAEADLRAGRGERALGGMWGALLLALACPDPQAAAVCAPRNVHELPGPAPQAAAAGLKDLPRLRAHLFSALAGREPETALDLLALAWRAREQPLWAWYPQNLEDLRRLAGALRARSEPAAAEALGSAVVRLYPAWPAAGWGLLAQKVDHFAGAGRLDTAIAACNELTDRLRTEAGQPELPEVLARATERLAQLYLSQGNAGAADAALRALATRLGWQPEVRAKAIIHRALLRHELGLAQAAAPFYERALREENLSTEQRRIVAGLLRVAGAVPPPAAQVKTSRQVQTIAEAAARQMATGQAEDVERAMRNLAELLRTDPEAMVELTDPPDAPRYVGLREYGRGIVEGLNPRARKVYRAAVAHGAQERCEAAAAEADPASLELVAADYPSTPAAAQALNLAANLYLDRGDWTRAASALARLINEQEGAASPLLRAKLAHALLADGLLDAAGAAADRLAREYAFTRLTIAGESLTGAQYAQRLRERVERGVPARSAAPACASTYGGSAARRGAPGSAPAPPGQVLWSRPLLVGGGAETFLPAPWLPAVPYCAFHPVASEKRVFVSGLNFLQAVNLQTGRGLWTRGWEGRPGPRSGAPADLPASCPTVQEGWVYLRVLRGQQTALRCYRAEDGLLRWSTEGERELRGLAWLSDPCLTGGLAIAVFSEDAQVTRCGVAALDALTGRLVWKRTLVSGSDAARDALPALEHLGPPAAEAGVVYAATGLGFVGALEARTGEVLWLSRYTRAQPTRIETGGLGWNGVAQRAVRFLSARDPTTPVLLKEALVLAPRDAPGLLAFARQGGALLWQHEVSSARCVTGAGDELALVAGTELTACRARSGGLAWQYVLGGQEPQGGVSQAGGMVYLPASEGVHVLDAQSGQLRAVWPWPQDLSAAANLIPAGGRLVGVAADGLVCLGPADEHRPPRALEEAQELLGAGQLEGAAERFARALKQEPLLPALQGWLDVLIKLGRREEALAELDARLARQPAVLEDADQGWRVGNKVFADAFRARLGHTPAARVPAAGRLAGDLFYAWRLEAEGARVFWPEDAADSFLVCAGDQLFHFRLAPQPEVLWQTTLAPEVQEVRAGPDALVVRMPSALLALDRGTGARRWRVSLSSLRAQANVRPEEAPGFTAFAVAPRLVAAAAGDVLAVHDLETGRRLWSNKRPGRRLFGLWASDSAVVETSISGEGGREAPVSCTAYDARSGTVRKNVVVARLTEPVPTAASGDGRFLAFRPQPRLMLCLDLSRCAVAWQADVPEVRLPEGGYGLRFEQGLLRYYGEAGEGRERGWVTYYIQPADGRVLACVAGRSVTLGNSFVRLEDEWGRTIVRTDRAGQKLQEVWRAKLSEAQAEQHFLVKAFLSDGADRLYLLYLRSGQASALLLRAFEWASGRWLSEQVLPGTPRTLEAGPFFETRGAFLLYGAQEGLFVYGSASETARERAARLRAALAGQMPAAERRDARRALFSLEPDQAQALLAPAQCRADGRLEKWRGREHVSLAGRRDYVPLTPDARWRGTGDLSARAWFGWNASGLWIAADVRDDRLVEAPPGEELLSGDCLRAGVAPALSSRAQVEPWGLVCTLASLEGRALVRLSGEPGAADRSRVAAWAAPAPDGRGWRYELLLPWPLLGRASPPAPDERLELRVGLAAFDDDGHGRAGAVEWGAGLTTLDLRPEWLGRLRFLDISPERIERLRQVTRLLPGAPETLRYLQQIRAASGGSEADEAKGAELEALVRAAAGGLPQLTEEYQAACRKAADLLADTPDAWVFLRRAIDCHPAPERAARGVQEAEAFLKRHPETPAALGILRALQPWYAQLGEPDPAGCCERLLQEARLPRPTRRAYYAQSAVGWTRWQVLGPFQASGEKHGMDVVMGPERGVELAASFRGPFNTDLGWRPWAERKDQLGRPLNEGVVDLHSALLEPFDRRQREDIGGQPYFAYAYCKINVPQRGRGVMLFGCNDRVSIWLNGRPVVSDASPGEGKDRQAADVSLDAGENEILLKLSTPGGRLSFFCRLADENGRPLGEAR